MKKVNKDAFSREVGNRLGTTHKDGKQITTVVFDCLKELLGDGRSVEIRGFGTWKTKKARDRKGRNPQTGEALWLPSHIKISFSPGKNLKEEVNE